MEGWQKQYDQLWKELVPSNGPAITKQGELIRSIGRLTDEAYRNGNENWGPVFEQMLDFVGDTLVDSKLFSDTELEAITSCLRKIRTSVSKPDLSGKGSCYYVLAEMSVKWCRSYKQPIPLSGQPEEGR